MKNEVIDYLQDAQQKAEEFGIIPKNSGSKSATNRFKGLFSRDVSEVSSDIAMAKKSANEIIAALTRLLSNFPTLKENIDDFKKLVTDNSESWQYVEVERATSLKILLLKNEKNINYDEYDGKAVDACLYSLSQLRMDDNEQEAVATISLADKMIDFFEKNVAKDNPLLLSAVKKTIAAAKMHLEDGRETYDDLESEAPDDVYQLAADEARFVINTINNFYNPQNLEDNQASTPAVDTPIIAAPPGLEIASKTTMKAPPGLGTGSPSPVPPDMPSFLQTGRTSPPPPPLSSVSPSHTIPTAEPPKGIPGALDDNVRDDRTESSGSDSGMGFPPPPIPSQFNMDDDEIDLATTPLFPEEGSDVEFEPAEIHEKSVTTTTSDEENKLYANVIDKFDAIANNNDILRSDQLADVLTALEADSTPNYWDNLYGAVAAYVYAEPKTRNDILSSLGKGVFEINVKSEPEIYDAMLELYKLLRLHVDSENSSKKNISISSSDDSDKISLLDLVEAMHPILNAAAMTHASKDNAESNATKNLRNSTADIPSQRKVTFDPLIPTNMAEENAKAVKKAKINKLIAEIKVKRDAETSTIEREALNEQILLLENELTIHFNREPSELIFDISLNNGEEPIDLNNNDDLRFIAEKQRILDELNAAVPLPSIFVPSERDDRTSSIPSLEDAEDLDAAVIHNSVTRMPEEFWTRSDDVNSSESEQPPVPPSRIVVAPDYDNLPEVFLGMIGHYFGMNEHHSAPLKIDELHVNTLKNNEEFKNNLILFVHAFNAYFSKENYTLEGAQDLMKHFDDVLLAVNKMINEHGYQFYNYERDADEIYQDNIRTTIKNSVAEELVTFAANINKLEDSNDISVTAIKDAVSLQRKALAGSILSGYELIESGGGGYCGDRSIIQSLREAILSGAISIPEDHELHTILQQTRGSIVGNEEIVSDADAKEFRRLYVNYLKRANEPYVESLMAAGISNVNLDTVGDQENVYWLTDIDMKYISKWLKVNLNVVQNVGDRDDTFSYKPEVGAESIGTINIFNQGYENQDGIHYQALLPKSRTDIADDYELVEPEVTTPESEFDQISSDLKNLSDDALAEASFHMTEIAPPVDKTGRGRLTAEQLSPIAGIDPRNRPREESRSPSPESKATVSNKRRGIFSGLNRAFSNKNKNASTKTAAVEPKRPASQLPEELNQRFQEQQRRQEDALFGSSPEPKRRNDLPNVTPVENNVSIKGLRRRLTGATSREATNRVQDSTTAPTATTTAAGKRKPGFVADGSHLINEELMQQNSSKERTPIITPPSTSRTNSSRVVAPEDTAIESERPELEDVRAFELDVHAIPRPVAPKSLVAMVRGILDDPNNNTELDYVDTKIAAKIEIVTKGDIPVQVATITDRKYDDPPGKLGTVTASGISGKDTYDAMSATLKLIAAMPDAERTAFIHPLTVRNITTREQVIGATRALYEYCVQVSGSTLAAEQAEALKDIYINSVGADKFKQALYEFLRDMPDDVYSDAYTQSGYKAFTAGLLTSTPEVSIVTGSRGLGTHPPRTQRDSEFKPLFGLLHNYTPPKSFIGSMLGGVKRALTGDDNPTSPKNRRS